jgi:hypothetical protein
MYRRPLNGRNTVPPDLMTRNRWRRAGYRVRPDAIPRGRAEVGMAWGGRSRICPLFAIEDCIPMRQKPRQRKVWDDPVFQELEDLLASI